MINSNGCRWLNIRPPSEHYWKHLDRNNSGKIQYRGWTNVVPSLGRRFDVCPTISNRWAGIVLGRRRDTFMPLDKSTPDPRWKSMSGQQSEVSQPQLARLVCAIWVVLTLRVYLHAQLLLHVKQWMPYAKIYIIFYKEINSIQWALHNDTRIQYYSMAGYLYK